MFFIKIITILNSYLSPNRLGSLGSLPLIPLHLFYHPGGMDYRPLDLTLWKMILGVPSGQCKLAATTNFVCIGANLAGT